MALCTRRKQVYGVEKNINLKLNKMKKLLLILALMLAGCTPEDPVPQCNCGEITDKGINGTFYWIRVKNNCTNYNDVITIDRDDWNNFREGDVFCQY